MSLNDILGAFKIVANEIAKEIKEDKPSPGMSRKQTTKMDGVHMDIRTLVDELKAAICTRQDEQPSDAILDVLFSFEHFIATKGPTHADYDAFANILREYYRYDACPIMTALILLKVSQIYSEAKYPQVIAPIYSTLTMVLTAYSNNSNNNKFLVDIREAATKNPAVSTFCSSLLENFFVDLPPFLQQWKPEANFTSIFLILSSMQLAILPPEVPPETFMDINWKKRTEFLCTIPGKEEENTRAILHFIKKTSGPLMVLHPSLEVVCCILSGFPKSSPPQDIFDFLQHAMGMIEPSGLQIAQMLASMFPVWITDCYFVTRWILLIDPIRQCICESDTVKSLATKYLIDGLITVVTSFGEHASLKMIASYPMVEPSLSLRTMLFSRLCSAHFPEAKQIPANRALRSLEEISAAVVPYIPELKPSVEKAAKAVEDAQKAPAPLAPVIPLPRLSIPSSSAFVSSIMSGSGPSGARPAFSSPGAASASPAAPSPSLLSDSSPTPSRPFYEPRRRRALVIGVSTYGSEPGTFSGGLPGSTTSLHHLANPVNDARLVSESLRSIGFHVDTYENPDCDMMRIAFIDFAKTRQPCEFSVIFFSGHGCSYDNDLFLVPSMPALPNHPSLVRIKLFSRSDIQQLLELDYSCANVILLDCCRTVELPFKLDPLPQTRSIAAKGAGPALDFSSPAFFYGFSCAHGKPALDADGTPETAKNSLFSASLARAIQEYPQMDINSLFSYVRDQVSTGSSGLQVPWAETSLPFTYTYALKPE